MKRPILSASSLMAVGLAAAVAVWMLSGPSGARGSSNGSLAPSRAEPEPTEASRVRVTVQASNAAPIVRDVVVNGRTEPNRSVEIKAETEGRVVALGVERGAGIAQGQQIVALDVRDRNARFAEAEALIAQHRLQYEAAKQLEDRQLVSEAQIAEAYARLVSARAALEQIRLDLERTTISAPFAGMLEERHVELGDYVGVGDPIARIADNDPLVAVGEVNEREIGALAVGSAGRARLVGGDTVDGVLRYVSPVADSATRTFRVEMAIPNPGNALPAGMTAELRLPAAEISAHFLSPALLTLDDDGTVGVKIVAADNKVRFHEVEIVRSARDGIWVTGLPDEALVITVGQGFVMAGETVRPVPATP